MVQREKWTAKYCDYNIGDKNCNGWCPNYNVRRRVIRHGVQPMLLAVPLRARTGIPGRLLREQAYTPGNSFHRYKPQHDKINTYPVERKRSKLISWTTFESANKRRTTLAHGNISTAAYSKATREFSFVCAPFVSSSCFGGTRLGKCIAGKVLPCVLYSISGPQQGYSSWRAGPTPTWKMLRIMHQRMGHPPSPSNSRL